MPDKAAIARGLAFEARVAESMGVAPQPGSGNQWNARGDVSSALLFQCKAERDRSWAQTRRELRKAIDDAVGSGKPGALAVLDEDGEELVVVRMSDLLAVLASDARIHVQRSRGEVARELADIPALLRGI